MRRPERGESRHRDEHYPCRGQHAHRVPQGRPIILNVLKDVQHQDRSKLPSRLELFVERTQMDFAVPRAGLAHQSRVGFDAFGKPELPEPLEEKAVSTAHV